MNKIFLTACLLAMGIGGCAGETTDLAETAEGASDSFALEADTEQGDVKIARAEGSRACSSAELNAAQQHANQNHTEVIPGHSVSFPTVTSCHVSNGWIVYTYTN